MELSVVTERLSLPKHQRAVLLSNAHAGEKFSAALERVLGIVSERSFWHVRR